MEHDPTPWGLIIMMFAYAFISWMFMFAIHRHIRQRRTRALTAKRAALGYGESWKSCRSSELE